MNIIHITYTTMAYMPARFVDLVNRYTEHHAGMIQVRPFMFGNPLAIWSFSEAASVVQWLDRADVLHFHGSTFWNARRIGKLNITPWLHKPHLLHFHGSPQREQPERYAQPKEVVLVSTPEMLPIFPGSIFFPNLIDETSPLYVPLRPDALKGSVCHHYSPHPLKKDTAMFTKLVDQWPYYAQVIPSLPLDQALAERAKFRAVFDHLQGYYGLVSIEALAQGIIPINGASDFVMQKLGEFLGAQPPFLRPSENTVEGVIGLLDKIDGEQLNGDAGPKFMAEHWSGKRLINKLIQIYEGL